MSRAVVQRVGPAARKALGRRFGQAAHAVHTPTRLAVFLLIVGGFALRLHRLGARSFWLDEVLQGQTVSWRAQDIVRNTYAGLIGWDQTPLFNAVTWAAGRWQNTELGLRMPSALAGTLTILAVYALGSELFSRRIGLIAGLLLAVMPFAVWYSQEARVYALLMLLVTLQMLFACRAVKRSRARDWLGLAAATTLCLYAHYTALLPTVVAAVYVGASIGLDRLRGQQVGARLVAAANSAALVFVAYLPWLDQLRTYLMSGSAQTAQRFSSVSGSSRDKLQTLIQAFGIEGLVLVALAAGIVACVAQLRRQKVGGAGLFVLWLGLPIAILAWELPGQLLSIWPRYLSFLYPAAILLVAVGADCVATGIAALIAGTITRRRRAVVELDRQPWALGALGVLTLLMLMAVIPALAHSYALPKDDYRGAVATIVASSTPHSQIIILGKYKPWLSQTILPYYLGRERSSIGYVDGTRIDRDAMLRLRSAGGRVWGIVITGEDPYGLRRMEFVASPDDYSDPTRARAAPDLQVHVYPGVTLVCMRNAGTVPALSQAEAILAWAESFDADVIGSHECLASLIANTASGQHDNRLDEGC